MEFTFLENALILSIFTHPHLHSKIAPKFSQVLPSHQAEGNYSHTPPLHPTPPYPPRQQFFENLFPPTAEKGGGKDDLFHQNSVRKYEHDLGH